MIELEEVLRYRREELEQTAEEIKKKVPPRYEHFADIVVEAVDESGNQGSLWESLPSRQLPQ